MSFVMMDIDQAQKLLRFRWVKDGNGDIRCRGCKALMRFNELGEETAPCPRDCPWTQLEEDVREAE